MNIVSNKSTLTSFVLAGLVAGSMTTTVRAIALPDFITNATRQQILVAAGLGSLLWVSCKESVNNPERVTLDELKQLAQIQNILTSDYWTNVLHLINDGYFGQIGKGKAVLGIPNEEDGTVTFQTTKPQPSTGICGRTVSFVKVLGKKMKDISALLALPVIYKNMWADGEKVADGNYADVSAAPKK